jgi:hypothetical protein
MHAHRYHHNWRPRVTWSLRARRLVAWRRAAISDHGRQILHSDLARRRADQYVAWRIAGRVFSCRGATYFPRYLCHPCSCRGIHLVAVFVRAVLTVLFCSAVLLNLWRNPDASPSALARGPLGAG